MIIAKYDSDASNNYWHNEDTSVITNVKYTRYGPKAKFPNKVTVSAKIIGITPLASSLSAHTKKTHIFDGLNSASLIYLGQLCNDDYIAILYKNEINIIKGKKSILKGYINKTYGLWDIPISRPVRH